MFFRVGRATASRRRRTHRRRQAPTPPPLAMLDLSKPGERLAHDFLLRATSRSDPMWTLLDLRRENDVLLCLVRWAYPDDAGKPYALAEVRLSERAVCWRNYVDSDSARCEFNLFRAAASMQEGIEQ